MTMPRLPRRTLLLLPFATFGQPAWSHSLKHAGIAIGHAWALPTSYIDGQAMIPMVNTGPASETLVTARSEVCAFVELRTNARYDHPAEDGFVLKPAEPLPMRPQATHLRLVGLQGPLKLGGRFPLVLDFDMAGEVEVEVYIETVPGL